MTWLTDPEVWLALITLTALEIVLGIDNIIFISILVGRLPPEQQTLGRRLGPIRPPPAASWRSSTSSRATGRPPRAS